MPAGAFPERDVEARRDRRRDGERSESEPGIPRHGAPLFVVGRVGGKHVDERLLASIEHAASDEAERDLVAAAAGLLLGDEHVHVGDGSVAHEVDPADLLGQVVVVAVGVRTVEEDPQLAVESLRRLRFQGQRREQQAESEREAQDRRHEPSTAEG